MTHSKNFSHGERQLLALARAIVQDTHVVLLLDEDTSVIDLDTHHVVQRTIAKAFRYLRHPSIANYCSLYMIVFALLIRERLLL